MQKAVQFPFIAALALAVGITASASPESGTESAGSSVAYSLVKSIPLGAPDRWDYVVYDAPSHRVYVAHGDRVTVVDGRDGSIVGQVEGLAGGTHGIAISHVAGRGYTDDGQAGQAASFDLKTLQVVKRLKAQDDADAITLDPTSGHIFVVNSEPGTLTVIDPQSDEVVAMVDAGSKLEYAVAGANGKVYANGVAKRQIIRIDTASNRVDATWPMPDCAAPHGLAIDTSRHRLFSSCQNSRLVVINADTGAVLATLPIGAGTDAAAFDSKHKLIFSSNGIDGTISVIREINADTFVPAGTLKTQSSARTMSVDPRSGRLYVAAADVDAKALAALQGARSSVSPPRRMPLVAGSLKLLFFDPVH
jgi:DNA-binding beta-propeller fold protein YncE